VAAEDEKLSDLPVRAVCVPAAIGALGEDDEVHTLIDLQGLTAAWLPGDHGLCLIVGGGEVDSVSLEPAISVFIPPAMLPYLARTLTLHPDARSRKSIGDTLPAFVLAVSESIHNTRIRGGLLTGDTMAWITTYKSPMGSAWAPAGRPSVIDIRTGFGRFRVFLSAAEVHQLRHAWGYMPLWCLKSRSK
jgi:hypothetical protein